MATKVNSVELYKSMSAFFRNVRYVNMVGESEGNADVSTFMNPILDSKDEFKRNVGKINSSSVHRYPGQLITRELDNYKGKLESARNAVVNQDSAKINESLENVEQSLTKIVEEFNIIKGS